MPPPSPPSPPSRAPPKVIILAAGQGTRMGGPKALMTVDGKPWWRVQQTRLRRAGMTSLWVVSEQVERAMATEADAPAERVLADSAAPMFTSLALGLAKLKAPSASTSPPSHIFVLPVDVPAPAAGTFAALIKAAGDSGVALPTHNGKRGHPACLSWAWMGAHLLDADPVAARLDDLLRPSATQIAVSDPSVTINLNTPDDVSAWLSQRA